MDLPQPGLERSAAFVRAAAAGAGALANAGLFRGTDGHGRRECDPAERDGRETTSQLYLASFIMDEARHFETLTRLYQVLGHEPLGVRGMPELMRYFHRLRQGDRLDWVWGILISDV